jgi:hypothetical protein
VEEECGKFGLSVARGIQNLQSLHSSPFQNAKSKWTKETLKIKLHIPNWKMVRVIEH